VAGVRLGAGFLIALAVGAAAAGTWVLVAIAVAGALAAVARWAVPAGQTREVRALATAAGLARVAVFGEVFGVYLFPLHRGIAAAVLVLAVAAADLAGLRLPEWPRKWITGALALAALVLVALCVAIPPVSSSSGMSSSGLSAGGVLLAVVVMFPWLLPDRPEHSLRRVAGATAIALVVAGAALYQLGPIRLGLSTDSMRDLLAAADAESLAPVLAVVVVLATVSAALGTFGDARTESGGDTVTLVVCAVVTAAVAGFATPVAALVLAAGLAVARVLVELPARYRVGRD
jgi:hypothetical protein